MLKQPENFKNTIPLVEKFKHFVGTLKDDGVMFFTSIDDFAYELTKSSNEKVYFGLYCVPFDLLLYSNDPDAHRILDFHMSGFLRSRGLSCMQHQMFYFNVCNRDGKKHLPTQYTGIYISTFAGKNLRTFGNYYLPKPEQQLLLENLR